MNLIGQCTAHANAADLEFCIYLRNPDRTEFEEFQVMQICLRRFLEYSERKRTGKLENKNRLYSVFALILS